jgi:hypothetical protein
MIGFNTADMHQTAGVIKTNASNLQSDVQHFWSTYQTRLDGAVPALNTCLSGFMNTCQPALATLMQGRTDLGTKLDNAATAVDQHESQLQASYQPPS